MMDRPFVAESLERRTLFAGVILEATGRLGPIDTFMPVMAADIANTQGGLGNISEYILSVNPNNSNGALVPSIAHVAGTGTPTTTTSGEIIVLLDYLNISANPSYSSTVVGAAFADFLMSTPVDGVTLASLPIDEIALSRGCGIIDGVAKQLGQAGVWVDQETYLDPDTIGAMGDPAPTIYDNVAFVDDYWRNDGIQSPIGEGQPVNGAYNLNVEFLDSNDAGWTSAHEAPTGYYIGTIDQTTSVSGLGPIYDSWYGTTPAMPARTQTGFIYTSLVGTARPLSGLWGASGGQGARTAAGQAGTQWGNITDLAVTSGSLATSNNSINISYLQQDRGGADSVTFHLDTDRNPLNNNFVSTLGTIDLPQSAALTRQNQTLSLGNVAPGSYWLCAEITNAQGNVRYAYTAVTAPLNVQSSGTITGTVFNDINGNGVQDTGELGAAGQTVYVDLDGSGQFQPNDPSATTTATGAFTLSGLQPGEPLTVREVVPAGFRQTAAPTSSIILSTGQVVAEPAFAITQSASIGGAVVLQGGSSISSDAAAGFQIILTEKPKKGKTIKLVTTTDATGAFSFNGVAPLTTDTLQIVRRKGFKTASHTRNTFKLSVAAAQIINGVSFSQVPILPPSQGGKSDRRNR